MTGIQKSSVPTQYFLFINVIAWQVNIVGIDLTGFVVGKRWKPDGIFRFGSMWKRFLSEFDWQVPTSMNLKIRLMSRLNSGIKNRNNFFAWAIFQIQKIGTNSVIYSDSGDIKILIQFFGNCVGGVYMRGCFPLRIVNWVQGLQTK